MFPPVGNKKRNGVVTDWGSAGINLMIHSKITYILVSKKIRDIGRGVSKSIFKHASGFLLHK